MNDFELTEVECLDYVQIDRSTVMIKVRETHTQKCWWRDKVRFVEKTYTGMISDRIWLDNYRVVPGTSLLALRLWEISVAKLMERRLDYYNSTIL